MEKNVRGQPLAINKTKAFLRSNKFNNTDPHGRFFNLFFERSNIARGQIRTPDPSTLSEVDRWTRRKSSS
jgi:hypothetical protein